VGEGPRFLRERIARCELRDASNEQRRRLRSFGLIAAHMWPRVDAESDLYGTRKLADEYAEPAPGVLKAISENMLPGDRIFTLPGRRVRTKKAVESAYGAARRPTRTTISLDCAWRGVNEPSLPRPASSGRECL
jgi:hypothetical protein